MNEVLIFQCLLNHRLGCTQSFIKFLSLLFEGMRGCQRDQSCGVNMQITCRFAALAQMREHGIPHIVNIRQIGFTLQMLAALPQDLHWVMLGAQRKRLQVEASGCCRGQCRGEECRFRFGQQSKEGRAQR